MQVAKAVSLGQVTEIWMKLSALLFPFLFLTRSNEVWVLDLEQWSWSKPPISGPSPHPRGGQSQVRIPALCWLSVSGEKRLLLGRLGFCRILVAFDLDVLQAAGTVDHCPVCPEEEMLPKGSIISFNADLNSWQDWSENHQWWCPETTFSLVIQYNIAALSIGRYQYRSNTISAC